MKYVVLKDFLDRFNNLRHCKPGELHVPPNEERAKQLIEEGFIAVVEVPVPSEEKDEKPKTRGRNRAKNNDSEQQGEVVKDGENDGEQTDESKEV